MNIIKKTIDLGNGRTVEIETGKLAKQADGSAMIKYGNTMLLATVCAAKDAKDGVDFMPLTVEYRENMASVGRIPGSFFKREARASDDEILVSRLIDRALRPLFPEDYHADVVVQVTLVSGDLNELPDAFACLAASAALAVSDVPFNGPISEVRVAKIDGQLVINPTKTDNERAEIDLMVAASEQSIVMVEGEMNEVSETEMVEAIMFAHEWIKKQVAVLNELQVETGKTVKRTYVHEKHDEDLRARLNAFCYDKCTVVAASENPDKKARSAAFKAIKEEFLATLTDEEKKEKAFMLNMYWGGVEFDAVRAVMLAENKRLDGRKMDEIRNIWSEAGYLPGPHGSALFTRGETQSLTTVTLGTKLDAQLIDGAIFNYDKKFLLHYNFPPFSVGEARAPRGVGRREVGHGALAHRSISKVMPTETPYTIRVVSDILESNGSSSMATVCAGILALMDAGVQIKKMVSGIAMGLVTNEESGKYVVLSDILGDEDHLGDMDFKVCGTEKGITGCQMDIKIKGLSRQLLTEALEQAKRGRLHILNEMKKTLSAPREDYKPHAPRVEMLMIEKEYIGAIIGPGGKVIQEMQRETGTTIQIEEVGNQGKIEIFSPDRKGIDEALRRIKGIVAVPEIGDVYEATVKSIMPYGAFVEFMPGKQGLLHISEVSHKRLDSLEGVLKENEVIKVKLLGIDNKTGKFKLSRKVLLDPPAAN
ncbi:MAG: polyribonucleotide nucleotidyltransferase [Chitinophagales bacterium]|nr:polyribonucleotide nucleotidyltransferase [Chitinophagales bacterium]